MFADVHDKGGWRCAGMVSRLAVALPNQLALPRLRIPPRLLVNH